MFLLDFDPPGQKLGAHTLGSYFYRLTSEGSSLQAWLAVAGLQICHGVEAQPRA